MADIWLDVDTALSEIVVNKVPLVLDTDGVTIDETVAYNEAGMDINWNFMTSAGSFTQTNVVPTTAGTHDWVHVGNGIYSIEMPASAGTINNDTEGYGWFSGKCTAVAPWTSPIYGFRAAALNNALCDGGDVLDVSVTELGGVAQSLTDLKDFADAGYDPATNKVTGVLLTDTVTTYTGNTLQTADVASGVTLAAGAITDASLAGNMEIVFETDFATNYNTTDNAWVTNGTSFIGTGWNTGKTGYSVSATGLDAVLVDATFMVALEDQVWDAVLTGASHNDSTSAGRRLRQIDAAFVVTEGTADAGGASTIDLETGVASTTDDIYNGDRILIVAGTGAGEHGLVLDYVGSTQQATMSKAWVVTPDATSEYILVPADCDVELWNDNSVTGDGDWADLIAKINKVPLSDGTISWNSTALADINAEVDTALADIGLDHLISSTLPTNWATDVAAGSVFDNIADDGTAVFDRTTDSLQAIADAGATDPWGVALPGSYTLGEAGYLLGHSFGRATSTVTTGDASVVIDSTLTEANDYWNGMTVTFHTGNNAGLSRVINDYDLSTTGILLDENFPAAHVSGDEYSITNAPSSVRLSGVQPNYAPNTVVPDAAGVAPTATEIVDEWETQSQADPTGFHVNVLEVGGTAQTANDNGADINTLITQVGTAGDGLTAINLPNQTMDITGDITGNLSGSVGSLTGHTNQTGDTYALANGASGFVATNTVVDAIDLSLVAVRGTADSGTTTTLVDAAALTQADDHWNGGIIRFTSGTNAGQARTITDFVASSDTVTFSPAAETSVTTETYEIYPANNGVIEIDANGRVDVGKVSGTAQTANDNGADINTLITQVGTAGDGLTAINLPNQTMDIVGNITGNLSGSIGSNTELGPAEVNAEVVDVLKTDTISDLTNGAPTDTPTFEEAVMYLYSALTNKVVVNTTGTPDYKEYYNGADTIIHRKQISDDGSDYTEDQSVAGS